MVNRTAMPNSTVDVAEVAEAVDTEVEAAAAAAMAEVAVSHHETLNPNLPYPYFLKKEQVDGR